VRKLNGLANARNSRATQHKTQLHESGTYVRFTEAGRRCLEAATF
jgi:hypothetical protein